MEQALVDQVIKLSLINAINVSDHAAFNQMAAESFCNWSSDQVVIDQVAIDQVWSSYRR